MSVDINVYRDSYRVIMKFHGLQSEKIIEKENLDEEGGLGGWKSLSMMEWNLFSESCTISKLFLQFRFQNKRVSGASKQTQT